MKEVKTYIVLSSKRSHSLVRKPDKGILFPAVIFVSGFGMDMHEWNGSNDEISKRLVEKGILTVQFDFSVVGTNRELGLKERAGELEDVLAWTRRRPDVDSNRIGIHATSFGVMTTLMLNKLPKTLCLVAGAIYPYKSITKVYEELGAKINYDGDTHFPRSSGEITTVGKEFWKSIEAFDPIEKVKDLTAPVFMIHGDMDTKVATQDMQKVYDKIPGKQKKLKIFRGGDHGIADVPRPMREEFLEDVVKWFTITL